MDNNYYGSPFMQYNVLYKIISKLLANRLRPLLHKMISPGKQPSFKIEKYKIIA